MLWLLGGCRRYRGCRGFGAVVGEWVCYGWAVVVGLLILNLVIVPINLIPSSFT